MKPDRKITGDELLTDIIEIIGEKYSVLFNSDLDDILQDIWCNALAYYIEFENNETYGKVKTIIALHIDYKEYQQNVDEYSFIINRAIYNRIAKALSKDKVAKNMVHLYVKNTLNSNIREIMINIIYRAIRKGSARSTE